MNIVKINENDYDKIYVLSDIHGYDQLLADMLKEINLQKNDLLIILGDSCDRGPNTKNVYKRIIQLKKENHIIHIKGNHEVMLLDDLVNDMNHSLWMRNGGSKTLESYKNSYVLSEHLRFIKKMPDAVESEHFYFVHAGIDPEEPSLEKQTERDLVWIREPFLSQKLQTKKIVIFGHTINKSGTIHQESSKKISIDCGSYVNFTLGCIEIKSMKEYYVSILP